MHESAPELDPSAIADVLDRNGVECVVIGGVAAVLLGAPLNTLDYDIVPAGDDANLLRLTRALVEMEAEVRFAGVVRNFPDGDWLKASSTWNFRTKFGDFDVLFLPAGTNGFSELAPDAIEVVLTEKSVRVASLNHLISMKEAADRPKDRDALEILYFLRDRPEGPPPIEP